MCWKQPRSQCVSLTWYLGGLRQRYALRRRGNSATVMTRHALKLTPALHRTLCPQNTEETVAACNDPLLLRRHRVARRSSHPALSAGRVHRPECGPVTTRWPRFRRQSPVQRLRSQCALKSTSSQRVTHQLAAPVQACLDLETL